METATFHLLTALYALCHGVALTDEDIEARERDGACLSPEYWSETKDSLARADEVSGPVRLELGFTPHILRWLLLEGPDAFAERYGLSIEETLARDQGRLAAAAAVIEREPGRHLLSHTYFASHAWSARAAWLIDDLPATAAPVLEALEQAMEAAPLDASQLCPLLKATLQVAARSGDVERAKGARARLAELAVPVEPDERELRFHGAAAYALTVLWCVCNDELLLSSERGLDVGIERSPETWARVKAAVEEGRFEDIPVPVESMSAWFGDLGIEEEAVRFTLAESAPVLPATICAIEWLLAGAERGGVPKMAAAQVIRLVRTRLTALTKRPPETPDHSHLAERLRAVLERSADV